ncbi:hypothetical protein BDR22DRAFT_892983 [Usnea florida]
MAKTSDSERLDSSFIAKTRDGWSSTASYIQQLITRVILEPSIPPPPRPSAQIPRTKRTSTEHARQHSRSPSSQGSNYKHAYQTQNPSGILWSNAAEKRFEKGHFVVVPDVPDQPTEQQLDTWEASDPKEYKIKVLNSTVEEMTKTVIGTVNTSDDNNVIYVDFPTMTLQHGHEGIRRHVQVLTRGQAKTKRTRGNGYARADAVSRGTKATGAPTGPISSLHIGCQRRPGGGIPNLVGDQYYFMQSFETREERVDGFQDYLATSKSAMTYKPEFRPDNLVASTGVVKVGHSLTRGDNITILYDAESDANFRLIHGTAFEQWIRNNEMLTEPDSSARFRDSALCARASPRSNARGPRVQIGLFRYTSERSLRNSCLAARVSTRGSIHQLA